jgi:putative redox protein
VEVVSRWEGGYRCRLSVRDHELYADEPESVGGTDSGPTPTELLIAAVASCFTMALAHVARQQDVTLPDDLEVRAEGESDGPRYRSIAVRVHTAENETELLEDLLPRAARVCYVSNTLGRSAQISYEVAGPTG